MKELVFVTNNKHKLEEISLLVEDKFRILSLSDVGFNGDVPETRETLEGNASQKSFFIYDNFGLDCFADDTGLEIDALNGRPGVYSARFAGPGHDHEANIRKVLTEMEGMMDRKARFRTVISLIYNNEEYFFEGIVEGEILKEKHGLGGFGYDPVFRPKGYEVSFAQMDTAQKNKISHRGRAVIELIEFLYKL